MTEIAFDLDSVAFRDEFDYEVLHPKSGKPTGWKITFAGPGNAQTAAAEEAQLRATIAEQEAYQKEASAALKAGKEVPTKPALTVAEFRKKKAVQFSAQVIRSTPVSLNGETVSLTADNALAVFSSPKFYDWLIPQIDAAIGDKANFIAPSAPIS